MGLLQFGKKHLWPKTKKVISFAWKNCKLELLIIIVGIIWMSLIGCIPKVQQILVKYFDDARCSGILGYTSVTIGIYVTVWSILATSTSKFNEQILKNRVDGQLFSLIGIYLVESFITTLFCAFSPSKAIHYFSEILTILTALTIVSFVKFIVLVLIITKLNIKKIVHEIDNQNAKCTEAQIKLDEIYQRTIDSKK